MSGEDTRRHQLHVYTPEEIEIFLAGDRREVDRLLLHGVNNLTAVFLPHAERQYQMFSNMGDPNSVRQRAAWIDAQIRKADKRSHMMDKVSESSVTWVLIAFIGFVVFVVGDAMIQHFKTLIGIAAK